VEEEKKKQRGAKEKDTPPPTNVWQFGTDTLYSPQSQNNVYVPQLLVMAASRFKGFVVCLSH